MRSKTNPRGAGRKVNTWSSSKMTVPDPLRGKVAAMIEDWKLEQKNKDK